jgi:hypothetical protein
VDGEIKTDAAPKPAPEPEASDDSPETPVEEMEAAGGAA